MTYAKSKASGLATRAGLPGRLKALASARSPDLSTPRLLALLVLLVGLIVAVVLTVQRWSDLDASLGDTDDATRLVLVRALVDGGGWWSQHLMRFQPPVGVYMHWSQLLTGGIAALDWLFRLALSTDDAETATRLVWPLLWIFPAVAATLIIAKRLGLGLVGNGAVIVAAVILASDIPLYIQFRPGRIDHHDVQMTLTFLALAGAIQTGPRLWGAVLAGVATGLGLAVGLEGLVFEAVIGAGIALRFVADPRDARFAKAYALSLAGTSVLAFLVQTPPWRWGVPACDALAVNLVGALAMAGMGLFAAVQLTAGRRWWVRLGALAVVGGVAGAVYLGLYPRCRAGFFADVDPRIRPIWLNYVQEVRPIWIVTKRNLIQGVGMITLWSLGAVAWAILGFRRVRWTDPAYWLSGACLAVGIAAGAQLMRASGYAEWLSIPLIAAATVDVLQRLGYANAFVVVLAAAVASPMTAEGLADAATKQVQVVFPAKGKAKPGAHPYHGKPLKLEDGCFDTEAYDVLDDATPAGLVLSEVDLGPFILGNTDHSALGGPYHRMGWGILRAHALLKAPVTGPPGANAYDALRGAGIAYVLECRAHAPHGDRSDMSKLSLQKQLDAGHPPPWLQPLSPPKAPLQAYRVLAPGLAAGPPPAPARP